MKGIKTLLVLIFMVSLLESCGKNRTGETDNCTTRRQKILRCMRENAYNYGIEYAQRMCQGAYRLEGCYR